MTHDEAVIELQRRYSDGARDVHDPDLFVAYERDIPAIARYFNPSHVVPDVRHLMFRDMRVWEH